VTSCQARLWGFVRFRGVAVISFFRLDCLRLPVGIPRVHPAMLSRRGHLVRLSRGRHLVRLSPPPGPSRPGFLLLMGSQLQRQMDLQTQ
jgi:hypothetical protein